MAREQRIDTCYVCVNVYCAEGGSKRLLEALLQRLTVAGSTVEVRPYVCFGACTMGPNMVMYPEGTWYAGVQEADLDDVVGHIGGGERVARLTQRVEPVLHELMLEILDAEFGE